MILFAAGRSAGRFPAAEEVPLFEFTVPTKSVPRSPGSLATSIVVHGLAVLLLFVFRFSGSVSSFTVAPQHVTLIAPTREKLVAPSTVPVPRPRELRPPPPLPARLELPAVPMIRAPTPEIPKPKVPETPRVAPSVAVVVPVVKARGFAEVKPAPPPAPKLVVKASGFESAETPATGRARGGLSTGSFDSAISAERAPGRAAAAITRSGFDSSAGSATVARRDSIASGTFGDTTVEPGVRASSPKIAPATQTPVEILSKPKPAYTGEARARNIEGEVVLDVQFRASGEARVLRVVRGLGAGLDETAIAAARGIRFRPATRNGGAVDSAAIVHIVFQLAN